MRNGAIANIHEAFAYDPSTGVITRRASVLNGRWPAGAVVGGFGAGGYRVVKHCGKFVLQHRLAWALHYGAWPTKEIDHINGVKTDNRIANLRECTPQENNRNSAKGRGVSGMRGASKNTKGPGWHSTIYIDGKQTYLGSFATAELARAAYVAAAGRLHGEFFCPRAGD